MNNEEYAGRECLEIMKYAKNYNDFLLQEILRHNPSSQNSILDFGAGLGTFAEMIRDKGYEVRCVEKDMNLRYLLQEKGLHTYANLEEIPRHSVPYIFSLNVLEHIEEHEVILQGLYECLGKGGILYLYVPAFQVIFNSFDEKVGHFRRYRRSSLLPLLRKAGFEIESVYYADSLGFLAALFYKFVNNNTWNFNPYVIRVYDQIFFPISRVLDVVLKRFFGKNLAVKAVRRN